MAEAASSQREPSDREAAAPSLIDVYELRIGSIWRRLKEEPGHFWLFCGYLFFEYVRPQGIYPTLEFFPWAQTLILGAFFGFLLQDRESRSLSNPLTVPVIGFFVASFVSAIFAFDRTWAFRDLPVLVNWPLLFVLFLWIVNTRFRFFIVLLLLSLASFKLAQHGFRVGLMRGFAYTTWGVAGPPGFFQNAADLGMQMAIYTPWAAALFFGLQRYWKSRLIKALFLFAPVAGLGTAIATGQRSTALAFVAMGLAVVAFGKHRVRNLLAVGLVGLVGVLAMSDDYLARFETAGTDATSQSRLLYWERGLEFFQDHPLIGIGYQNWIPYYRAHYPGENVRYGKYEVAHSVPVTVAAETGLLGLALYAWVVVAGFVVNTRSARVALEDPAPLWRYIAWALNLGLIGFVVGSVFLSVTYYPFLWVQAGLSAALYRVMTAR